MTEERHHTDAEYEELAKKHDRLLADWWKLTSKYDELKAKLDSRERRIKELCLWGQQGEKERIELRAELARLKEDAPPLIYDSNAKMWILAGAVLLRNQAGELLGLVRASDYYEKDREKK